MKTLNLTNENLLNAFSSYAVSNEKMNYVRGGGDPIPPDPTDIFPWIDDDEQP